MREILLFAEDSGHEAFLVALVERMAKQQDIAVTIRPYSVRGGHGTVLAELKNLRHEIQSKMSGGINTPQRDSQRLERH
jgi:hypothetical protein